MLLVSPHPGFLITGFRQARDEFHPASGQVIGHVPGVDVEFVHGGVPTWAADVALDRPQFQQLWGGLPDGVDRRMYLASYDTVKKQRESGWSDEFRVELEEWLVAHPDYGTRFVAFESPEEKQEAPWPNYDKTHWKQVVRVAQDIQADLAYVLEYERAHGDRRAVVAALEEAVAGEPVEDLVEA